jgi:WD40 repeat protein
MILATAEGDLRFFSANGRRGPVLEGAKLGEAVIAWSQDSQRVVVAVIGQPAGLWNLDGTAGPKLAMPPNMGKFFGVAWSPDGKRLASASRDKTSKVFNAENGESLMTYSGHGDQVFDVGFSGDGKLVLTAGADKKIHAWNPDDGAKKGEIAGFGGEVLTLTTDADKIISGSAVKTVQQHRLEGFKQFKVYPGHTDAVFAVAYHPATGRIAAGSFSGQVRIWNAEDGAPVCEFIAAPGYAAPAEPAAAAK